MFHQIFVGNCTVPKDTVIIMSVYYLQRNKDVWGPNADMFNPDNFLPEKMATRHPYSNNYCYYLHEFYNLIIYLPKVIYHFPVGLGIA